MAKIFELPRAVPVNSGGVPYSAAKCFFYVAGTLTAKTVWTDAALTIAHPQPVVADANGVFPAIYINRADAPTYRIQLKTSASVLIYDEDNISADVDANPIFAGTVTAAAVTVSGAVTAATAAISGNATVGGNETITGTLTVAGTVVLARTQNLQTGAYQFVASDAGTQVINTGATSPTYTVPANATVAFTIGTELSVVNYSTGTVTIAAGGGVTVSGYSGVTGLTTIATMQSARIRKTGADTWLILDPTFLDFAAASFTATLNGCTVAITGNVRYRLIGDRVILTLQGAAITGISNATSFTFTGLPALVQPTAQRLVTCILEDNTVITGGWGSVTNSGTVTFGLGFANNAAGFTNSGTKGLPLGWQMVYDL